MNTYTITEQLYFVYMIYIVKRIILILKDISLNNQFLANTSYHKNNIILRSYIVLLCDAFNSMGHIHC